MIESHARLKEGMRNFLLNAEPYNKIIRALIADAVAIEREECAKICDVALSESEAAVAIRARGNTNG